MAGNGTEIDERRASAGLPGWAGYIAAPALQAVLTVLLLRLDPWLPISAFPFAHIIGVMLIAYFFSEGSAIVAYVAGLVMYTYSSTYPTPFLMASEAAARQWAGIAAYAVGAAIVGLLTIGIRRSHSRVQQLVDELQRERALLDTYAQNVPVGLALHDRSTRHLIANQALARFLGLRREEIIGKTVWESLPPELADKTAAAIGTVYVTGQPVVSEDMSIDLDCERHFHIQHHPVRTSDGRMIGVGIVMADITDQVEARRNLERIYERERHIAETLQSSLVGVPPPQIGQFQFESFYRAAMEEAWVGGDFHDVFLMGGDKIGIVIGDVSGKGLSAAVQVAMVKYTLRSRAYESDSPGTVMGHANLVAARSVNGDGFITVFFGVLDCSSQTLTYASAGHSPTMLWKATEGRTHNLPHTGHVLGIGEDISYGEQSVRLEPGDEILLGTDGLYELKCGESFLDLDGLIELHTNMRQLGPVTAEALVERVKHYCGSSLRDDVAILRVSVAI